MKEKGKEVSQLTSLAKRGSTEERGNGMPQTGEMLEEIRCGDVVFGGENGKEEGMKLCKKVVEREGSFYEGKEI